ncbi:hypothetical protein [uncultured Alistipes sp.]|uniref:hypothetical protein n=1 Tax=uncultured Alistipes sp. TaxID=538949 RepID=UPI00266C0893|nr:hypothetical protein [uncultured Alistipes sp.]
MGLMGNAQPMAGADSERLFAAGVACICCEAWPMAYDCFERSAREDAPTRYNQALCCFHVGWYEESYRLLAEAERLLDDQQGEGSGPGNPPLQRRQLPDAFRRWEVESELPRSPLLPETPRDDALTLILRLRAEAAFRLGRCEEVRTIAARLGHRYEHLENLLKTIDR